MTDVEGLPGLSSRMLVIKSPQGTALDSGTLSNTQ
jgi:hypothetical protein